MMTGAVVFILPQVPDSQQLEASWWLVDDRRVLDSGTGIDWIALAGGGEPGRRKLVALAPAASVRTEFTDRPPSASERQASSVARLAAIDMSLGESPALHAVSTVDGDKVLTAVVDNGLMLAWLDWTRAVAVDPDHVVPVGALLPSSEDWTVATIGTEEVIGRAGTVLAFEPELAAHIVGNREAAVLSQQEVEAAIVAAASQPPLDLRTGRMARRRRIVVDRDRIRKMALIALMIPLLALIYVLVAIMKLNAATDRLNGESLAVAGRVLGRPLALENAESDLSQRLGGGSYGGVMTPLTGLYSALQAEQSVSATELSYRPDGTLAATLAAPTLDAINRVLVAVQRDGYRITAVPRQAPDGRSMVDVTVRTGP
ncbi:MAG: type II secretion system protein GspL [Alphaproteobacteria bacterium]